VYGINHVGHGDHGETKMEDYLYTSSSP
jgi:hypothetical protein